MIKKFSIIEHIYDVGEVFRYLNILDQRTIYEVAKQRYDDNSELLSYELNVINEYGYIKRSELDQCGSQEIREKFICDLREKRRKYFKKT